MHWEYLSIWRGSNLQKVNLALCISTTTWRCRGGEAANCIHCRPQHKMVMLWYLVDRKLGQLQSQSEHHSGKEKSLCSYQQLNHGCPIYWNIPHNLLWFSKTSCLCNCLDLKKYWQNTKYEKLCPKVLWILGTIISRYSCSLQTSNTKLSMNQMSCSE